MVGHPLSEIHPCEWLAPDLASFDALLVGSANALQCGGAQLAAMHDKPVHAVGEKTAATARELGFATGIVGSGGLQEVVDALPDDPVRLLRLAGADHVELGLHEHIEVITRVVYEIWPLEISDLFAKVLGAGEAIVLLHSAGSAEHFARECDRLGIDRARVRLAALGPRIAAAAGAGWGAVESAPQPSDAALLALARDMCH